MNIAKKAVNIMGFDCDVEVERFSSNNQICLILKASNTALNKSQGALPSEPISKPSVYLEGVEVKENQTIIKDYSECQTYGVLGKLIEAKIVKETGSCIDLGFGNMAYLVDVLL